MLEKVDLFENIEPHLLEALEQYSLRRHYPKNTMLFMEGDENTQLFIIEMGKVSVFVNGNDGRQVTLNFLGPGCYFGELSLIDGAARSASVMTVTDSSFVTISKDNFRRFILENPDFAMSMMQKLVRRIRDLTNSVKDLALLDVYGRVSQLLLRLGGDAGCIDSPKLTHQEIANMVGASREMVSRIMKELVMGGYIEQTSTALLIKKRFPDGW